MVIERTLDGGGRSPAAHQKRHSSWGNPSTQPRQQPADCAQGLVWPPKGTRTFKSLGAATQGEKTLAQDTALGERTKASGSWLLT